MHDRMIQIGCMVSGLALVALLGACADPNALTDDDVGGAGVSGRKPRPKPTPTAEPGPGSGGTDDTGGVDGAGGSGSTGGTGGPLTDSAFLSYVDGRVKARESEVAG